MTIRFREKPKKLTSNANEKDHVSPNFTLQWETPVVIHNWSIAPDDKSKHQRVPSRASSLGCATSQLVGLLGAEAPELYLYLYIYIPLEYNIS